MWRLLVTTCCSLSPVLGCLRLHNLFVSIEHPSNKSDKSLSDFETVTPPNAALAPNRSEVRILFALFCERELSDFVSTAFRFTWLALSSATESVLRWEVAFATSQRFVSNNFPTSPTSNLDPRSRHLHGPMAHFGIRVKPVVARRRLVAEKVAVPSERHDLR